MAGAAHEREIALAGTRRALGFVAASSVAGFIGLFVVVGGAVSFNVAEGRADMVAKLYPIMAREDGAGALFFSPDDYFRDQEVDVSWVHVVDESRVASPPGVKRLPEVGELVVSPAAAALIEGDSAFAERYPGEVVGLVGPRALAGPNELVVWQGVDKSVLKDRGVPISGFGSNASDLGGVPDSLRSMVPLLVLGFLLPVAVLFYEAASTGARSREPRLAALRLMGASMRRLRVIAVLETMVATIPGVVVAALAFGPSMTVLGPHLPVNGGVWPSHLQPSLLVLVGVCVAIVALAGVVAWWSLARVRGDFLSVVKRAGARKDGWGRLLVLAAGVVALAGAALIEPTPGGGVTARTVLLMLAVVLLLVGLVRGLPVIVNSGARLVERSGGPWVLELGASKTSFSPVAVSRVASGAVVLVFLSGLFLTLIPSTASGNSTAWRSAVDEDSWDLIIASGAQTLPSKSGSNGVLEGVREYAAISDLGIKTPSGAVRSIAVVDCAGLTDLLGGAHVCVPGGALVAKSFHGDVAKAIPVRQYADDAGQVRHETVGDALGIAKVESDTGRVIDQMAAILGGSIAVIDAAVVASGNAGLIPRAVIADPIDDIEESRTAVLAATQAPYARTVGEMIAESERTTTMMRAVAQGILAALALVAAATVAAALSGHLRAERAALDDLWRIGVPLRAVRSSLLIQAVFGLLPGVMMALTLGVGVAAVFIELDSDRYYGVPWQGMTLLALGALAVPLATTAAMSRSVRIVEMPRAPQRAE